MNQRFSNFAQLLSLGIGVLVCSYILVIVGLMARDLINETKQQQEISE